MRLYNFRCYTRYLYYSLLEIGISLMSFDKKISVEAENYFANGTRNDVGYLVMMNLISRDQCRLVCIRVIRLISSKV